jgi:uncharacterized membrane protein
MMKKLSLSVISLIAALTFVFAPLQTAYADPVDVFKDACNGSSDTTLCKGTSTGLFGVIKTVINVMLVIGGIIAVIMIILGAIRYITSNGDQADVKAAKDTILYAVIGLIVASVAFAVVNYIIGSL